MRSGLILGQALYTISLLRYVTLHTQASAERISTAFHDAENSRVDSPPPTMFPPPLTITDLSLTCPRSDANLLRDEMKVTSHQFQHFIYIALMEFGNRKAMIARYFPFPRKYRSLLQPLPACKTGFGPQQIRQGYVQHAYTLMYTTKLASHRPGSVFVNLVECLRNKNLVFFFFLSFKRGVIENFVFFLHGTKTWLHENCGHSSSFENRQYSTAG